MNKKLYDTKVDALNAWLSESTTESTGELWVAQYDPPWPPGPLRRNNILVLVDKDSLPKKTGDQ